jgi:hypothetical protein
VNNLFIGNHLAIYNEGAEDEYEIGGLGGGAIAADAAGAFWAINNTFAGNWASAGEEGGPGRGGAIYLSDTGGVHLYNNIFYDNDNPTVHPNVGPGPSVFQFGGILGAQDIRYCAAYSPWSGALNTLATHYYTDGSTPIPVAENYWNTCPLSNPLFVSYNPLDPASGDYHLKLQPTPSPCIDRGVNPGAFPYGSVPTNDFDPGHARPVDITNVPNYGSSAYTDMGAYEVQQ